MDALNRYRNLAIAYGAPMYYIAEIDNDRITNEVETRAGKLLRKGKPFVVVAVDEPYYALVYSLIRRHETKKGTWSAEDETAFKAMVPAPTPLDVQCCDRDHNYDGNCDKHPDGIRGLLRSLWKDVDAGADSFDLAVIGACDELFAESAR